MRKLLLLLPLLLPLLGLACDPPSDSSVEQQFEKIARDRAAVEFPCGWEHIAVAPLEGWAYRVEGCGMVQIYECGFDNGDFGDDHDKVLYVCRAQSSSPMSTSTPASPSPCTGSDGG